MRVIMEGWDANGNGITEGWEIAVALTVTAGLVLGAIVGIVKSSSSLSRTVRRWMHAAHERLTMRRKIRNGLRSLLGLDGTPGIRAELRGINARLDDGARRFDEQTRHLKRQDINLEKIALKVDVELSRNGGATTKDNVVDGKDATAKLYDALLRAGVITEEPEGENDERSEH